MNACGNSSLVAVWRPRRAVEWDSWTTGSAIGTATGDVISITIINSTKMRKTSEEVEEAVAASGAKRDTIDSSAVAIDTIEAITENGNKFAFESDKRYTWY